MSGKIKGLGHLAINVKNMKEAEEFYCEKLGIEKIFEINMPENIEELYPNHPAAIYKGKHWISYLRVSEWEYIELFQPFPNADPNSGGPNFGSFGFVHFCLVVDDIHSFMADIKQKDVYVDSDATLGPDGSYQAWIRDPDGHRIEIFEYTKDSTQVKIEEERMKEKQ
jgi:lactoylglutathione lyase